MELVNLYSKKFSKIHKEIQEEKVINYNITISEFEGQKCYGIHIISYFKDIVEEDLIENISTDKQFVKGLITYLYENSIDCTCFKDIVQDIFNIREYNEIKALKR